MLLKVTCSECFVANTEEYSNLERAHQCSKHILEFVNQAVKDCENHQRLIDLQRRIDKKADGSAEMEDLRVRIGSVLLDRKKKTFQIKSIC